jgi:glycosyltransferase involved in cell wall biosynthesis
MKILLYFPEWGNRWADYVIHELAKQHDVTHVSRPQDAVGAIKWEHDVWVSMWCDDVVREWAKEASPKPIVTYLRRYELFQPGFESIEFGKIKTVVCVSKFIKDQLLYLHPGVKAELIPNGVSLYDFPKRLAPAGLHRIAMMASMRAEKNIPLAAQVLLALPKEFTLHHVGMPSALLPQIQAYFTYLGLGDRYIYDGFRESHEVQKWLSDKDWLLSTSMNEGNPNNVIEAMAMGIRPVIHGWPGALDQFPRQFCFRMADEAASQILDRNYEPDTYREWVEQNYSLANFERLNEVIERSVA